MPGGNSVPVLRGTFKIRSPRSILLLTPDIFVVSLSLFALSLVFTFWPEALDHSPTSFEKRGLIHHAWHYTLMLGSALTLVGLLAPTSWRLKVELVGVCLMIGMLGMNLAALVTDTSRASLAGMDVALRFAFIIILCVRAYTVAFQPTVNLTLAPENRP